MNEISGVGEALIVFGRFIIIGCIIYIIIRIGEKLAYKDVYK